MRRLDWQVLRRLDGRLQGAHRSAFRGTGIDVNDLRDYEPGDDVRHIDWNVTARMDTPFVRQFLEDREVSVWLLADRSPSMGFGPADRTKDTVLAELVISLAALLGRGGNRVGALVFDHTVAATIEPRPGRTQTLRIATEVLRPVASASGPTDLSVLLRAASGVIRRRSVVVVLSDFISVAGWERPLGELARRHDVVAVRVLDRREFELPAAGVVVFEDAETGEQLVVDTTDPELHRRLRDNVAARETDLVRATTRAGVQLVSVSTEEDLLDALVRLVTARKLRRAR